MQTADYDYAKEWEEISKGIALHEAEVKRKNERIFRAIKKVKGKTFLRHLKDALEEYGSYEAFKLVRSPQGTFQREQWGRGIPGYWCIQWCTNMEGDSFSGFITFKLKDNLYLESRFDL